MRELILTDSKQIEKLTDREWQQLEKHCQNWLEVAHTNTPIDRQATTVALQEVYQWLRLPKPMIFWCQSPWQMAVLPIMIQMLLMSRLFWQGREQFAQKANTMAWRSLWNQLNVQLDPDVYQRLRKLNRDEVKDRGGDRIWRENGHRRFTRGPTMGFWGHSAENFWETCSLTLFAAQQELVSELNTSVGAEFGRDAGHAIRTYFDRTCRSNTNMGIRAQMEAQMMRLNWSTIASELLTQMPGETVLPDSLVIEPLVGQATLLDALGLDVDQQFSAYFTWGLRNIWWGSWSIDWLALHEFLIQYFEITLPNEQNARELKGWCDLARQGIAYSFYTHACFVCDRPIELHQDHRGNFHNDNGPAVAFADGYEIYAWHGTAINKEVILRPEEITAQSIQFERNAEVRRVMIERFGQRQIYHRIWCTARARRRLWATLSQRAARRRALGYG